MRRLFDVNVLIALGDTAHPHHVTAMRVFTEGRAVGWASCPMTENGMIRVMTGKSYPGGARSFTTVVAMLEVIRTQNHRFISDDISLTEPALVDTSRIQGSGQITDAYLLALAVKHRMRFCTLDARIDAGLVVGGVRALEIIPVA